MPIAATLWQWILQHHTTGDRTFIWWWKAFNPNDEGVLLYDGNEIAEPEVINESYSYWLWWVSPWTEILLGVVIVSWPVASWTINMYWGWSGGTFWSVTTSVIPTIPTWSYIWYWIGTWFRHWEIISNGSYTLTATHTAWLSVTKNFTISWIVWWQTDRYPSWHIWVEGDTIAYTDACTESGVAWNWYKHRIPNDWSNLWSWHTPWYKWIDSSDHGKIHFIDSSWVHRRTILWDYQWVTYDSGALPQTPWSSKAGYIYAQDITWFHWTYLMFVANDGRLYRISHTTNLQ